jgi:hypothetical protein
MKYMMYLILPLTIACVNVAYADAKQVNLPFHNEPIFSRHHSGLVFNYDLGKNSTKKVVCKLSYVYEGWLEFQYHGQHLASHVYGHGDGVDQVVLTHKGQILENQYPVDRAGSIKINAINHEKAPNASASCHYAFDDTH